MNNEQRHNKSAKNNLGVTEFKNFTDPNVLRFVAENGGEIQDEIERAIALYYAVRDQIYYDPFDFVEALGDMRASRVLEKKRGFCVNKAILLAAACRSRGIPARVGLADVRNHITTAKLRELMGTDIFYGHGYTELFLNKKWVKCTPAFNQELCERAGINTLEFNGVDDSLFHPFDKSGREHMEYIKDYGSFTELPIAWLVSHYREQYPQAFDDMSLKQ